MARLFSSLQRLERTAAVVAAYPFTMACWVYDDGTVTAFPFLMNCSTSGTTAQATRIPLFITDTGKIGSTSNVVTSTTRPTNTWFHACGVHSSATNHAVFLDGGGKGTSSTNFTFPSGMNRTTINAWNGGTNVGIAGNIAHCAIWNVALDDAEVLELANGLLPTRIRPQSLTSYWSCYGSDLATEIDPFSRNDMTNQSSTVNANVPRISQAWFIA